MLANAALMRGFFTATVRPFDDTLSKHVGFGMVSGIEQVLVFREVFVV